MQLGIWHLVGTEKRLIHPRMCSTKGGLDVSRGLGVVMVHWWRLTACSTRPIWWGQVDSWEVWAEGAVRETPYLFLLTSNCSKN